MTLSGDQFGLDAAYGLRLVGSKAVSVSRRQAVECFQIWDLPPSRQILTTSPWRAVAAPTGVKVVDCPRGRVKR
jgi:hypothetical protein